MTTQRSQSEHVYTPVPFEDDVGERCGWCGAVQERCSGRGGGLGESMVWPTPPEHSMRQWEWSDNPNDPCMYDVQWRGPNGAEVAMMNLDQAEPYWPGGQVVARVYREAHARCMDNVASYESETERGFRWPIPKSGSDASISKTEEMRERWGK